MRGRGKIRVLRFSVSGQLVGAGTSNPSFEAGFGVEEALNLIQGVPVRSHIRPQIEALIGICLCDLHSVGLKTMKSN